MSVGALKEESQEPNVALFPTAMPWPLMEMENGKCVPSTSMQTQLELYASLLAWVGIRQAYNDTFHT